MLCPFVHDRMSIIQALHIILSAKHEAKKLADLEVITLLARHPNLKMSDSFVSNNIMLEPCCSTANGHLFFLQLVVRYKGRIQNYFFL